ncbi:maleylacetate reductase [Burkholderia diffusa]|uniref:maleylacetate reductase n=1 Tax=Burkholderia diffusa TaxID=488732 RepID=A0AAW3PAI5_9BURK|nr:maleylacetate reductase [Burkholderia diffusa]KWF32951.1 maleylacetate reductase [Burkholderia diffusa]KWF38878.1 maleylacetate reductase [Burkholderia diffusa]KWF46925.1 maleylacetate reductase [Burkholderia diffusa]KWF50798.1 maleylacetate reductase [Burkholderia diffusa]
MNGRSFRCDMNAAHVCFGAGSIEYVASELDAMGGARALILCTPSQRALAERVADLIGVRGVGIYDKAVMHVPTGIVRDACEAAATLGADCTVAIGGGSTIGLAKGIALHASLPILAVPTTYAGSEMTPIYGLTEGRLKKTGRDTRVLPRSVIYDSELTLSLPRSVGVTSGMNAIAHAAEGLYAPDGNPLVTLVACEGIAAVARALPPFASAADDQAVPREAREEALYGAWLCGMVLGNVRMGLHHKLCHTLGGTFNLPHAETHTVVLPHALAYNASHAPQAMASICAALGAGASVSAARACFDLAQASGAPTSLRALGLREEDIERALSLALQDQYPNPRPLEAEPLRVVLRDAFHGVRPH